MASNVEFISKQIRISDDIPSYIIGDELDWDPVIKQPLTEEEIQRIIQHAKNMFYETTWTYNIILPNLNEISYDDRMTRYVFDDNKGKGE